MDIHLKVEEHISEDWFIQKPDNSYDRTNFVVMSQVPYAIPDNYTVDNKGFRNLVIKVPPGSVTFNPGRESLSLNKETVDFLNKQFKEIADDYVSAATIAMVNTANDAELMATYKSLYDTAPGDVAQNISPEAFTSDLYKNLYAQPRHITGTASFYHIAETDDFKVDTGDSLSLSHKSSYYKTSKPISDDGCIGWTTFFNASHVIVDLKTKFRAALNEKFRGKTLITWQKKGKSDIDEAVCHATRYLEGMGIEFQLASDLVDVSDVKSVSAPREGLYVSTMNCNGMRRAEKMDEEEIEEGTYLYLKMKNSTPDIPEDDEYSFSDYHRAYMLMAKVDSSIPEVKGVAKKYQHVVEDLDNWVCFQTYIKDKMEESTFRVDCEEEHTTFTGSLISHSNVNNYPKDIQDYYYELRRYANFKDDKSYIFDPALKKVVESFNATLEPYEWDDNNVMSNITEKYPQTGPLLTGRNYYYHVDADFVVELAKLEEFYAIHSSK